MSLLGSMVLVLVSWGLCCPESGKLEISTTLVNPPFKHTLGINRVNQAMLILLAGSEAAIDNPEGIAAVKLEALDDPSTEKDDDEVTVYGVNSGKGNIIYSTSIWTLDVFGEKGRNDGQFLNPSGIAADRKGNVYVADTGNHRVVHLLNSGGKLKFIANIDPGGTSAAGGFDSPKDVAVGDGEMFVTDYKKSVIQVFDSDYKFKRTIENVLHPLGIAVNDPEEKWSYRKQKAIYVIVKDGKGIMKLDWSGNILSQIDLENIGFSGGKLLYLALDYYDNVYATDQTSSCVHKFDRDLNYITSFSRRTNDGKLISPRGIAISRQLGQVFVVDPDGVSYYWIGTDFKSIDVSFLETEAPGEVKISLVPTERSFVDVNIFSGEDQVRRLAAKSIVEILGRTFIWDLKDEGGNPAPPGEYTVEIGARSTYSSYKHFEKKVQKAVKVR